MPKELTHWMIAHDALERLESASPLRRTLEGHRSLYLAGAVLPDTLLHVVRGPFHPTARELAHHFHDAAGNSYDPLMAAEASSPGDPPPALMAALLGIICHMQADIVLHPFVYALTGREDIGKHYRLETDIDVHFLRRGALPPERLLAQLVGTPERPVLLQALRLVFDPGTKLPEAGLDHALTLHCRIQGMYDRFLWKLAVLTLARTLGSPFREQQHLFYPLAGGQELAGNGRTWHCPATGETSSATVEELAEESVDRTVEVFRRIERLGSLREALREPPGANLLTGRHGITHDGGK